MAVDIGEEFKIFGNNGIRGSKGYGSIGEFVGTSIIPNVLMISSVILFFMIVLSGFMIIGGAGNAEKQKQAGQTLTWSIVGFLIVFGAYWILQILGNITGIDILNIDVK